ncbi:B-cell differentiation antigen CD72 isoform X2 [Myotis daubentonii]|uniref:B-cell differentiation antigen CD72 isoform X2 n=1 Tax=Myotis daubentonii TaxID=98922 RepID=UPI0028732E76|nr:B-cell differentiation antigen CD72 isoform X2 [Myotis daubentonii]
MAESVTYADLRFVKAPLKKRVSSQPGQDPEADDDGELTYENVQVPTLSGGASNLASSGLGDKAGVQPEPPAAPWSSVTSPAAWRLLGGHDSPTCWKYLLLGLLLTCLLLGVAAIALGVRYLQVSQQLQRMSRALDATNSSLRQQLRLQGAQLGQQERELQGSRRELAQTREALQVEQRDCQAVRKQSQAWLAGWEETKEALRREETQRSAVEERLNRWRDTLKPLCVPETRKSNLDHLHPSDPCCPVGWILMATNCFYISLIKRSWEDSQNYCKSLSSNLATITDYRGSSSSSVYKVLEQVDLSGSYWIDFGLKDRPYVPQRKRCPSIQNKWSRYQYQTDCATSLPCVCEMAPIRYPDYH